MPETTDGAGAVNAEGGAAVHGNNRRKSTRNYEVDRTVSHSLTPSGRLQRLSAAVVIDDRKMMAEDGTATQVARTPEELARFTALVKDAIGFDAERGDTVNVTNAAFVPAEQFEPLPAVPIWKQPWVWDLGKQVAGALFILILVFGVLRPFMRNLVGREVAERELAAASAARLSSSEDGGGAEGGAENASPVDSLPPGVVQSNPLDTVKSLIDQDPKRVANAMRTWVSEGD